MHKGFRRSSDLATVIGVAALVLGSWLLYYREGFGVTGKSSLAVGVALLFLAFVLYVRAKGYPAWWSLLFFVGAFWILWILPDRHDPFWRSDSPGKNK
jgi:hypothetical protein